MRKMHTMSMNIGNKYVTETFKGFEFCYPLPGNIVIDRALKCGIFRTSLPQISVVTSALSHNRDTLLRTSRGRQ